MPAKWIDECRNKATDTRKTIDFELSPIPFKQRHSAKNTNNKKTKQKTAMQISPQDHNRGQQKPSRSFHTFSVEYNRKQHRTNVRRNGRIKIRIRRKSD